jgi:hypothetical protein
VTHEVGRAAVPHALERLAGKRQLETLHELGDALWVRLEPVSRRKTGEVLWFRSCGATELHELDEVLLKAGGGR